MKINEFLKNVLLHSFMILNLIFFSSLFPESMKYTLQKQSNNKQVFVSEICRILHIKGPVIK